jgi:Ca2+-binding RTX toxin-like protein
MGIDNLRGGAGDDYVRVGSADETVYGGSGTDTAEFGDDGHAVYANLSTNMAITGEGTYFLKGIENLIGTNYGDTLTGDSGPNVLDGALS